MKYFVLLLLIILTGCTTAPTPPTAAEQNMADMMGITVEELRDQTPEEHMEMMNNMHSN